METVTISGVVRCQICRQPMLVTRSFSRQLRHVVCTNPLCNHYGYARETTLYTRVPGQPTSHGQL